MPLQERLLSPSSMAYHKRCFVKTSSIPFLEAPDEVCGEKPEKGANSSNFSAPSGFPFLRQCPVGLCHIPTTPPNSSNLCPVASPLCEPEQQRPLQASASPRVLGVGGASWLPGNLRNLMASRKLVNLQFVWLYKDNSEAFSKFLHPSTEMKIT